MGKLYQKYIDEFVCLAGECPDTCCAGWQIYIDEQTADRYLSDKGEIGVIARENMRGKPCSRRLALTNGRCPYLNKDGLCKVIISKGENALSTVCSMHPRFIHPLYEDEYVFLSLSCPKVAQMFVSAVKNGGIGYVSDDLQNPYLSQFYAYVCEISDKLNSINVAETLCKTQEEKENFTAVFNNLFSGMEYIEKPTKQVLSSFSYEAFTQGYDYCVKNLGRAFFSELYKYFALALYDEKSPILPVAFVFCVALTYLCAFLPTEKAISKFVKETEHSERNIRHATRIIRSKKAENCMRGFTLYLSLYGEEI